MKLITAIIKPAKRVIDRALSPACGARGAAPATYPALTHGALCCRPFHELNSIFPSKVSCFVPQFGVTRASLLLLLLERLAWDEPFVAAFAGIGQGNARPVRSRGGVGQRLDVRPQCSGTKSEEKVACARGRAPESLPRPD